MADFPTYTKNDPRPTQPLTVTAPTYDANEEASKTAQEVFVEQQWRDVAEPGGAAELHPLSINRDASQVTTDPYDVP